MIKINNWSSYQSYKDRMPPWIRFHRSMLDNYEFQKMSAEARALLPMLWLLASEDKDPVSGQIRIGYEKIAFRLRIDLTVLMCAIKEISESGFIVIEQSCNESVTNTLHKRTQSVTPETETETETENNSYNTTNPREPILNSGSGVGLDEFRTGCVKAIVSEFPELATKNLQPIHTWQAMGADLLAHVLPCIMHVKQSGVNPSSLAYFTPIIQASMNGIRGAPQADESPEIRAKRLIESRKKQENIHANVIRN